MLYYVVVINKEENMEKKLGLEFKIFFAMIAAASVAAVAQLFFN